MPVTNELLRLSETARIYWGRRLQSFTDSYMVGVLSNNLACSILEAVLSLLSSLTKIIVEHCDVLTFDTFLVFFVEDY
jgi:hypothetical protein